MQTSRIPNLNNQDIHGVQQWFEDMHANEMLFHPDDDPADIISIESNIAVFSADEVTQLRELISQMFERHGNAVYDAAYPIFMNAVGMVEE